MPKNCYKSKRVSRNRWWVESVDKAYFNNLSIIGAQALVGSYTKECRLKPARQKAVINENVFVKATDLTHYQEMNRSRNKAIIAAYQLGAYTIGCHYSTVNQVIAKCDTCTFIFLN